MGNKVFVICIVLCALSVIYSFDSGTIVKLDYPASWPVPAYDFEKNPLTEEGIQLGRALFYDPILSRDSTVSCANCHLSYTAFTHVDHALSHGIGDSIGARNSMALTNLAWNTSFMWDGSISSLDEQVLTPISHEDEMGQDIDELIRKLNASATYRQRFTSVFNSNDISEEHLMKALAQFQLTLITSNSKYDRVMRKEEGVAFTQQEEKGQALFMTHCNSCHTAPLFTDYSFQNNGLTIDERLQDMGRMDVTGRAEDAQKFKVPSLRNVEFSRPYMHDGRFKKLSQVIAHYSDGIHQSETLAKELINPLTFNAEEKVELLAFMLTLSDKKFLFNPQYAHPR